MTTTLERPQQPAHEAPQHDSAFTGTLGMLRLYLRRDRIVLPLWVLLLSTPLATVYIGSIEKVYPDQAARAGFAATIMASPAQRALYGKIYNDSLGATGIWKAGMFHLLIAVAVILTVIRHTRADEETGRAELVDSTAVGRYASLTAAWVLSCGASLTTGALGAAGLLGTSVPAGGSLAFGAALACSGLVFTAVAAVAAQLSASARVARGAAFAVLATAFTLRAVGDAGSPALSWLSPLGWSLQVRPYAGDRWWVLLLHLATTLLLTALAYQLLAGRDVGAGLIAERPGPGTATPLLRNAFGLAWRLDRGALLLWTVGLCLYGLLIGSIIHGIGDELGGDTARDIVVRMGGTNVVEQAFVAAAFCMLGMMAAAFAVSLTLRLHQEEASQRAETLLSGAVSRSRWLTSHLVIALIGSASRDRDRRCGRRPQLRNCRPRRRRQTVDGRGHCPGSAAGRVAAGRGDRRIVRAGTTFQSGRMGCAGRVRRAVPDRFAVRLSAVGARPGAVRAHPACHRRRLHAGSAAVLVGDRRRADRAGNGGLSPPRRTELRRPS